MTTTQAPFAAMTVAEIVDRLCGVGHVTDGGASLFHDELGHIISTILLTRWPTDPRITAPVVWSTDTIIPEQLAELCQRMLVRALPRQLSGGLVNHRIHVKGTLDNAMLQRIEERVVAHVPGPLTMNWPDENGDKLSKLEALAWTWLFAVEDIHIFAERYSIDKKGQPLTPARLAAYRERVGELMYAYAIRPELSQQGTYAQLRDQLIDRCFEALDMERERAAEVMFGDHLSDTLLERWYETFLPHFEDLDRAGVARTGRAFSRQSITELRALEARTFLPTAEAPFDWCFVGEPVTPGDRWLGVLQRDEDRDLWLIFDVIPPASAA